MTAPHDIEPFEREWLTGAKDAVDRVRASRAGCPPLRLVSAARAGALPDDEQRVVMAHLSTCTSCSRLEHDLAELASEQGVTDLDTQRIWSRVQREVEQPASERRAFRLAAWWPLLVPVAAALVVTVALWPAGGGGPQEWATATTGTDAPRPAQPPLSSAPMATGAGAIVVEKPDVKLSMGALTWRGDSETRQQFLTDLAPALNAYRADRYEEAISRLVPLEARYPKAPEVAFFLGVSRLLAGREAAAVDSLRRAVDLRDDVFTDDAAWYLAVALQRAGRSADAQKRFSAICGVPGPHMKAACAANEAMGGGPL